MLKKQKKINTLVNKVNLSLNNNNIVKKNQYILISISGGQDSICSFFILLQLKRQWNWSFGIIYCNHLWQKNTFFVNSLIIQLAFLFKIPIYYALPSNKIFTEYESRYWRYGILYRISYFYKYTIITTGHTLSDKIETILFQLIRGTSTKSLTSLHSIKYFVSTTLFTNTSFFSCYDEKNIKTQFFILKKTKKLKNKEFNFLFNTTYAYLKNNYFSKKVSGLHSYYRFKGQKIDYFKASHLVKHCRKQNYFNIALANFTVNGNDLNLNFFSTASYPTFYLNNLNYFKTQVETLHLYNDNLLQQNKTKILFHQNFFFRIFIGSQLKSNYNLNYSLYNNCINWPMTQKEKSYYEIKKIFLGYPLRIKLNQNIIKVFQKRLLKKQKVMEKENHCLLIRPLLNLHRFDLKKLIQFWNLPVYPDKTNKKVHYSRNRIRKQLLPTLRFFFNPQIDNNLFQFSEIVKTEQQYLTILNSRLKYELFIKKNNIFQINSSIFYGIPVALQKNLLKQFLENYGCKQVSFFQIEFLLQQILKNKTEKSFLQLKTLKFNKVASLLPFYFYKNKKITIVNILIIDKKLYEYCIFKKNIIDIYFIVLKKQIYFFFVEKFFSIFFQNKLKYKKIFSLYFFYYLINNKLIKKKKNTFNFKKLTLKKRLFKKDYLFRNSEYNTIFKKNIMYFTIHSIFLYAYNSQKIKIFFYPKIGAFFYFKNKIFILK